MPLLATHTMLDRCLKIIFPGHSSREVCAQREREEVHSDLDLNLLSVNKSLNGNQETVFLVAFVIII